MVLFRSLASLAERGKKNLKFGLTTTKKNCQGIVTEPVKEELSRRVLYCLSNVQGNFYTQLFFAGGKQVWAYMQETFWISNSFVLNRFCLWLCELCVDAIWTGTEEQNVCLLQDFVETGLFLSRMCPAETHPCIFDFYLWTHLGYKSIQVINLSRDLGLVSCFLLTSCRQLSVQQAEALKCPSEAVIFPQLPKKLRRLA